MLPAIGRDLLEFGIMDDIIEMGRNHLTTLSSWDSRITGIRNPADPTIPVHHSFPDEPAGGKVVKLLFFCWLAVVMLFPGKGFLLCFPDYLVLVLGRGVDRIKFKVFCF